MKKLFLGLLFGLAITASAQAQVRQSGTVTPRHAACWTTSGTIQDCGTAAVPFASSLGTLGSGPTICMNSAAPTGAYNRMCLGATTNGASTITSDALGGATGGGLNFVINGTAVSIPTTGGTFILGTAPFTAGHAPCFVDSSGGVQDCGVGMASGSIVSGNWAATPIPIAFGGTGASSASAARTSLGLGTIATQDASAVIITGGSIVGMASPTIGSEVATKTYVDSFASGLRILAPSTRATAAALAANTYNNGASGVGATLTANGNGALTVDGGAVSAANVIVVKNEVTAANNGIYTVTATGDGSNPYVLTRVTYFDTAAEMLAGSYTLVTAGSTNSGTSWTLATTVATVGSSAVIFNQFSSGSLVTSVFGRTGAVAAQTGDYSVAQVTGAAPLASPTFTTNGVTINTTAASTATGFNITQSGPSSGSLPGTSLLDYNLIAIADPAALAAANDVSSGLRVVMSTGSSNAFGTKIAGNFVLNQATNSNTTGDLIGLNGRCQASVPNGGTNTGAGAAGTCFGFSSSGQLSSGGTNYFTVSGGEIDIGIDTGGSARNRLGWSIIGIGNVYPSTLDGALEIGAAGLAWKTGVLFSSLHGTAPVATTGTLIGTDAIAATVTHGIDVSAYTITGYVLKSTNATIAGDGRVVSLAQGSATAAGSFVNARGIASDSGILVAAGATSATNDTTSPLAQFTDTNFVTVGQIRRNGPGAVIYVGTSDERLKTPLGESSFGLSALRQIRVRDYYRNDDEDRNLENGFFAQELAKVYPYAVAVGGDDPHKNPWSVDYGRLSPLIVRSVQELDVRLSAIERRQKAMLERIR